MFKARPNLNGNDEDTVLDNYASLDTHISRALQAAGEVCRTNFHGRDYQTVEDAYASRKADLAKMHVLITLLSEIQTEISNTVYAIDKENN